jgi:hypothetical protein
MNSNKTSSGNTMPNTTLRDLDKFDDLLDEHFSNDRSAKQGAKLTGRKRPDQSARMSGNSNSMAGKEHPNKGKSLPQIGRPGVAKPKGHGAKVSAARKGVPNLKALGVKRPDHSNAMKDPARNTGAQTMRETMTCLHCGKTANVPNYKRWHGDNCKMKGTINE